MSFGISKLGLSPFGLGAPLAATAPVTNAPAARFLNINTGDFEQNDDGSFVEDDVLKQRILLTLATSLGSAADLPSFGNGIFLIKKIDNTFDTQLSAAVRNALKRLVDVERLIQITSITNKRSGLGRIDITIDYIDLTKNLPTSITTTLLNQKG